MIELDDHEGHLRGGQPFADEGPDPAEPGDDRMSAKCLDLPHHALMTQVFLELSLGEQRQEPAQRERHREQPQGDDQHRVQAKGRRHQRVDLGQPDRRDRDEHLVEGVHERPAHRHVAGDAVDHDHAERREAQGDAPHRLRDSTTSRP